MPYEIIMGILFTGLPFFHIIESFITLGSDILTFPLKFIFVFNK